MPRGLALITSAAVGLLLALFAACGGEEEAKSPTATARPAPAAAAQSLDITIQNTSFGGDTISLEPGKPFAIKLSNKDSVSHNLHIYQQKGGASVAVTNPEEIKGGATGTLQATIERAGEYYFQCDFHPTQAFGKVAVKSGAKVGLSGKAPGGEGY